MHIRRLDEGHVCWWLSIAAQELRTNSSVVGATLSPDGRKKLDRWDGGV